MPLYSPRRRVDTEKAASVYAHPRCVPSKGSSCETRPDREESRCTIRETLRASFDRILCME